MFSIRLMYNDGKDLVVNLPKDQYDQFLKNMQENNVHWDPENIQGFWTNLSQIRYMSVTDIEKQQRAIEQQKAAIVPPSEPIVQLPEDQKPTI